MAELKVSDVAERHGVSARTARRWMVELERKFGPRVIGRRGSKGVMFTTEDAMGAVVPLAASKAKDDRRFRDLEERVEDVEKRADKTVQRIAVVERQVKQLALGFAH